jgi:hypothetical protein
VFYKKKLNLFLKYSNIFFYMKLRKPMRFFSPSFRLKEPQAKPAFLTPSARLKKKQDFRRSQPPLALK